MLEYNKVTVGTLRYLPITFSKDNKNIEIENFNIVWKINGKEFYKNSEGESTLKDYLNIYDKMNCGDNEELEFSDYGKIYKLKDIKVDFDNSKIIISNN